MKGTGTLEPRAQETNRNSDYFVTPEVNIFETQEGYVVEAEMPGVSKDGLEVTLEGNELTLVGHKNRVDEAGEPLLRECVQADFKRVFELDPAIDTGKISAKMDQGILRLTLPKSEKVKPRKITIE
jgi:HSP20 family protein